MSQALYRKYRPEAFKEVLGQEHVVSVLEGALKQGNVAHAYLFSGSRGTGKTSMARIVARALDVSEKDIYEFDAASHTGVDDIREIRDGVGVLPFESPYKVYIIDEVHMLSKSAFNALLKTLEEPPAHAIFILATTEQEKLPETVVSRCQTFLFRKPSQQILKEMVTKVSKSEGFALEPAAADLVALLADGSFRDAHGILQKIIASSSDKKISLAEVETVTAAPSRELINGLIRAIAEKKPKDALAAVHRAVEGNIDQRVFLRLLLHKVRMALLLRYEPSLKDTIADQFSAEDIAFIKEVADDKDKRINSMTLRQLLEASLATNRAYIPQLPLELALMDMLSDESTAAEK